MSARLHLRGLAQSGATSGQVPSWDNAAGKWSPASLGGGASGDIVALKSYWPASQGTYTIASATLADVDATNAAVTFTAPASGNVLIRLQALAGLSTTGTMFWCLRSGTTAVFEPVHVINNSSGPILTRVIEVPITGLTPGNSYTYKWAWKVSSGTGTIYYGSASGDGRVPMLMVVTATL